MIKTKNFPDHEEEFFKKFVVPERCSRYLSLLESKNGRKKVIKSLDHFDDLNPRYLVPIPPHLQNGGEIAKLLKDKGSPDVCYIMSSNSGIDGNEISLVIALDATIGNGFGTIVSCIPGKLAYFEGEGPNDRYILES